MISVHCHLYKDRCNTSGIFIVDAPLFLLQVCFQFSETKARVRFLNQPNSLLCARLISFIAPAAFIFCGVIALPNGELGAVQFLDPGIFFNMLRQEQNESKTSDEF